MNTGEAIKYYRTKSGMTQKRLAEISGVSEISIRKYESNDRTPKIKTIFSIAGALKVDFFDLISVEEYNHKIEQEADEKIQESIKNGSVRVITPKENELINYYYALNDNGQDKAVEQVKLLTKIPEYRKGSDQ